MVTHSSSDPVSMSVGLSGVGQAVADLEIELSPAGQLATVSNNGPSDASKIDFTIEGRKALLSPSATSAVACHGGGGAIACSIGSLPAGTSVEAPMGVEWYEGWEIAAQVRGGPHDPDKANNFDLVSDSGDSHPIPYTAGLVLPQVGGAQVAQNKASRAHCGDSLDEGCEGALPFTGADLLALGAAAFGAIGLGAALAMVARRAIERRKEPA